MSHPLITTLKNLRGNVRACVYTEPLWGIPYNLFAPFASIYMLALGLSDAQVGLVASIGLACQTFWMLLSGAITDKWGRKRTTLIFDIIAWTIPCLIWALARDFTWFVAGAIINSVGRITINSWQLLLVEDTAPHLLVDVYTWVYISGLVAAFFSPLTGMLIGRFSLVPTMRAIYLLACALMTAKFILMNCFVAETRQGLVRMHETASQPLWHVLREYQGVLGEIRRAPHTRFAAALLVIVGIGTMIQGTFWSILVTEKLLIPPQHMALYPFARSLTILSFFFLVMPRLRHVDVRTPILLGFAGLALSQVLLISVPARSYALLLLATVLEGVSVPAISAPLDKLVVVSVEARDRARIMAILYVLVIICTTPFGWTAGRLSEINRGLPFAVSIALYVAGALLTYRAARAAPEPVRVGA